MTDAPRPSSPGDEPVEVVDEDGNVIDVVARRVMRAGRMRHRTVFVVVESSDGRFLVHRRSPDKDIWPGWWDMTVGGVVACGEGWDDAARREMAEEIGVVDVEPQPLGGTELVHYEDDHVRLVGRCYHVVHDGPFRFADGEVVEARFVAWDDLLAMTRDEPMLPDSLTLILPLLAARR